MVKIWDVPIEPFEERYSIQWQSWFAEEYRKAGVAFEQIVPPEQISKGIETGSFLDVHGTNWYKAEQLKRLICNLKDGRIKDGDWIVFHDLWFPGIEMLAYIRDGSGVKFKIGGTLQAGSWDRHDFLVRKGMRPWAQHWEAMLFQILDTSFLSTQFHKDLILRDVCDEPEIPSMYRQELEKKLVVTGHPIFPDTFVERGVKRQENLVVFPHRLDPEKCPEAFRLLAKLCGDTGLEFVVSRDVCKTKKEYYELLAKATYAVSFALQETWGIATQEALFSGCIPIVPGRLSYREMYDPLLQVSSVLGVADVLRACERDPSVRASYSDAALRTAQRLRESGANAIASMVRYMTKGPAS